MVTMMITDDNDDPKFLLIGIRTRIAVISFCNQITPVLARTEHVVTQYQS
jgi:hypothetical protein